MIDEDELVKLLTQIMNADKTPIYEYRSDRCGNTNYLNAKDLAPNMGCRWSTPTELCKGCLRDIGRGKRDIRLVSL